MTLASQLATLQNQIMSYYLPPVYAFGMVGNAISIFIFSDKQIRTNICSWYFICASLSQLLLLNSVCLPRMVIVLSGYDSSRYNLILCKFRGYLYILSLILSRHFICLISFDRWLVTSSSERRRRLSSPHPARWIISCSILFWSIFSIHALIGYQSQASGCAQVNGTIYDIFHAMYSIITALSPMMIVSIFSILTIMNVRKRTLRQIQPVAEHNLTVGSNATFASDDGRLTIRRKRDKNMIQLAFVQVASYIILNIATAIYPLYSYLTRSQRAINADQQAISSFVNSISLILLYTYSAVIFFVYIVASSAFRGECVTICKQRWIKLQRYLQTFT